MERLKTLTTNLCRFVLAATFILSGFVKAVDPMGTAYKINDYLAVMQWQQYVPEALTVMVAMLLAACEFGLGISMLFAIRRRATAHFVFLFLSVMTPLTLWLAIDNPIRDCGCFGDAFLLTNWQTFGKNAVLWLLAATVVRWPTRMPRFIGEGSQWIVVNYSAVFILAVASYGLYFLPLFDFRPYHVGVHIPEAMTIPEGAPQPKFETTFILAKDGVQKEFTIDNYPDSTWTFVDSKTVETEKGYEPPIHDFSICTMEDGEDITLDVLNRPGYTFLLIAPHLRKADDSRLDLINLIYEYAEEQRVPFYCLTASGEEEVARWKENTGAEYLFCQTDETTLKTIIRSNPGLMLLKNGVVYRKWSCNNLPAEEQLGQTLATAAIGQMESDSTAAKIFQIVVWYVLPLLLLTIADRLWAWTRWLRRKKTSNRIYQLFKKKKKMRKKIVAGNWKMNMNLQEGVALAKELNETLTAEKPNCGVVICTPFIHLASIAQFLNQDVIGLGAENCADKEKGAYTGEVSAEMVKSTGAQYVILGHSERRGYYGETPEILKEKVLLALKNGLKVIFCIGESLEEREANKQNEVCKAELEGSVFNLTAEEFKNIIIAYEPIWAIGTGKTATAEQAEEIHAYIRSTVAEKYGNEVAEETTILYGGSCKASNAPELFAKPDIDGGLIGGASLKAADFKGIIDAWKK
ncbi:MAG: BT_3928 family protein [Prevotella sp.]